jgi:hypothetical protein
MRKHSKLLASLIAVTGCLFAPAARAQSANTGSIGGVVTDGSGAALQAAKVTVTSPNLIASQTSVTNDQGRYRFPTLPVGIYTVKYELAGFATLSREQIDVATGFAVELNVTLGLPGVQQNVTVTGETPLVDTQDSNIQNNFNHEQMHDLPSARDVWAVTGVSPGIRISNLDVGGSQTGSQGSMTSYGYSGQARTQLDGINTTEGQSAAGFYFDFGSFQEVTVGSAANDASMPVPGQFINIVLKGGGNRFHGSFYQDYENGSLQGSNVSSTQLHQGAGTGSRLTEYHDTDGDIGGPILRDRLWFYTSLRDQLAGHTVTGFPVEAPNSNTDYTSLIQDVTYKLTGQINPKHRFSQFVQWERKLTPLTNAASNYYKNAAYIRNLPGWSGGLEYDGTLTSRLFVTARVGVWGYNVLNAQDPSLPPTPRRTEQQTGNIAGTALAFRYNRRRIQYEPTGSYFLDNFLKVNHEIKFGWLTEHELYDNQQYGPVGEAALTFNSAAGSPDFTTPYRVTLYNGPTVADDYQWHHGAYVQDQIRVSRRVTVNAGVRWDYYRVFEKAQTVRPDSPYRAFFYGGAPLANGYSIPATYSNYTIPASTVVRYPALIVPRLGLAWDLTGQGKTVLKISWGRFHSNPNTDFGSSVNPVQTATYTFNWNDLNHDGLFQPNELGSFVSNTGGAASVAQGIENPRVDDAGIFVERQISNDLSIRAGFVYRTLSHNWQKVDIARTANLFTQAVQAYDPGPDGVKGTADDRGNVTVYDIPSGIAVPASQYQYQAPDGNNSDYKNYEVTVNRRFAHRWSTVGTFYYTFNHYLANGVPTNPNMAINNDVHTTDWTAHIIATYAARWGVQISPILRGQSGATMGRVLQISERTGTLSDLVDPIGAYRTDNIWLFDTRIRKQFRVGEHVRVDGFFDAFNILNTNANQTEDNTTGVKSATVSGVTYSYQRFLSPTSIMPPRVFRVGVRFSF